MTTAKLEIPLDAETRVQEGASDHKTELRLWLRMLTCTNLIESEIRRRLQEEFNVTLPRFDLMAQLEKAPDGLTLGEVSRRMMVSNGNVTGLAERLVSDGLIERRTSQKDRRTHYIRLTAKGRRSFEIMARRHGEWMSELFTDIPDRTLEQLMDNLNKTKRSVVRAIEPTD